MDKKSENFLRKLDEELGGFGWYQKRIFLLACLPNVMSGLFIVNHVFTVFEVPYRCAVPACENASDTSFTEDFLNFTTPYDDDSRDKRSSCDTYGYNASLNNGTCDPNAFDSSTFKKCSQWVYDNSEFTATIVSDFDLTCGRSWLQTLGFSAHMLGMPFGAIFLGDLADRLGRRRGMVIAIAIAATAEFIGAFSVSFYMYAILRMISGAGAIASFQLAVIQALENAPSEKRSFCGVFIKIPFAIGEASVAGFAYFIRSWRWLQLALAIPPFFLLSYLWIMPESIRWLLSKGRKQEARKQIGKAASVNKVEISKGLYESLCTDIGDGGGEKPCKRSPFDLLKYPRMRKQTFILILSWIIITHGYYALSTNSSNFGGNIFVSFLAIMLIEIPSYIFAYFILDVLGRKGTLSLLLLLGGLVCFAACLVDEGMATVFLIMNLIGKFCISAAFIIIYVYTIELYPTPYRSLGLGTCSMSARLGGFLAPYTSMLGKIQTSIPLIIIGVITILCGCLLLFLPETYGSELPQTLEESEVYGKDQPILYFTCLDKKKRDNPKE